MYEVGPCCSFLDGLEAQILGRVVCIVRKVYLRVVEFHMPAFFRGKEFGFDKPPEVRLPVPEGRLKRSQLGGDTAPSGSLFEMVMGRCRACES